MFGETRILVAAGLVLLASMAVVAIPLEQRGAEAGGGGPAELPAGLVPGARVWVLLSRSPIPCEFIVDVKEIRGIWVRGRIDREKHFCMDQLRGRELWINLEQILAAEVLPTATEGSKDQTQKP